MKWKLKFHHYILFFSDERGSNYELENERKTNLMLYFRNQGTISGRHYHTGGSKHKDPEIIYLLQGEALLRWKKLDSDKYYEKVAIGPSKITISTYIWHELKAITSIIFIEMNSFQDGKEDIVNCGY